MSTEMNCLENVKLGSLCSSRKEGATKGLRRSTLINGC